MISCTIIPTHPEHFGFAIDALRSHAKFVKTELYFIFFDDEDLRKFRIQVEKGLVWDYLILPPEFRHKNIVTAKKLWAVNELSTKYDFIGVFDSEIRFVREMDTDTVYKEIAESRLFKSNRRYKSTHLKDLAKEMGLSENKTLIEETENFTQYWWFNEICVYESSLFKEFYEWLIANENFSDIIDQFISFDYLMYSMWLICFKGFKLKKIMQDNEWRGAAVETNFCSDDISLAFMSRQDRNNNYQNLAHINVQIMLDRDENHCKQEGGRKKII